MIAGLAWAHGNLSAMFGDVPLSDVLILLVGLPLVAAVGGWLLAGREPEVIARQPLDLRNVIAQIPAEIVLTSIVTVWSRLC